MRAVNLIPSDQRSGGGSLTGRSGGAALILLALVFGVAVLAVLYGTAARTVSKETGEVARVETQIAQVQARTGRLQPYISFVQTAEQRTKTVAQLVQARFDWSHMLHELGRVLPADAALQSLAGTIGASAGGAAASSHATTAGAAAAAAPSSSTPPGSVPSLTLSGCTTSQAEVALMLQQLKLMDGVAEVALHSSTQASPASGGGGAGTAGGGGVSTAGGGGGGCGGKVTFSVTATFAALPSTPLPNVVPAAPAATPASGASARGAHTEQISAQQKGAKR